MPEAYIVPPCKETVDILYEDDHLLFVRKPHLLLSIPGRHPANRDCVISRLLLRPETGRSHQLRIHLAASGHPILGCDLYAHKAALAATDRLLLHASELGFEHPVTGEWIEQSCPPEF